MGWHSRGRRVQSLSWVWSPGWVRRGRRKISWCRVRSVSWPGSCRGNGGNLGTDSGGNVKSWGGGWLRTGQYEDIEDRNRRTLGSFRHQDGRLATDTQPTSNPQEGMWSAPKCRYARSLRAVGFEVAVVWLPKGIRGGFIVAQREIFRKYLRLGFVLGLYLRPEDFAFDGIAVGSERGH